MSKVRPLLRALKLCNVDSCGITVKTLRGELEVVKTGEDDVLDSCFN